MTLLPNTMPPRKDSTKVVRRIWSEFEKWAEERRTNLERECEKLNAKWRATSTWSRSNENNESRRKEVRLVQERYISSVREEWDNRLRAHMLKDADWGIMTAQEQDRVFIVLGGDLDEAATAVEALPPQPSQRPPPPSSVSPQATTTTAPPPATAPVPVPVPSSSSTARTTSSSTSSYSFVDPADFTTDDELYEAVSSYITVPTDESESDEPIAIKDPELWGMPSNGLGRSSNHSSQSASPDHTSPSNYNRVPYPPDHRPELNAVPPKRPPDVGNVGKSGKARLRGPSYVGPSLIDPDETSDEEVDFERFKMETRIKKIWEFHYAAAQADIELAMDIYNDRVTKTSSKAGDASKVAEHEKRMLKMQAVKEEERKEIVSAERKKRRDEIRRRAAQAVKNVNTIEVNSIQRNWDSFFDHRSSQLDFDERGCVVRRKGDSPPMSGSSTEDHAWENRVSPQAEASSAPLRAFSDTTLRGRPSLATPSGWKTTQVPSAASPWQTQTPHTSFSQVEATSKDSFPHSLSLDAEQWGMDGEGSFGFPGSFPDDATGTPFPSSLNGWPTKKSIGASKLAQVATASSPPDTAAEVSMTDTSFLTSSGKKLSKKQRPANQKKGTLAPALTTAIKAEAESPTTPTLTPKFPTPKEIPQKSVPDEELSSTPRPHLLAAHMKRSAGLTSGYMSDVASTPRISARRLDHQLPSHGKITEPPSEFSDETPWQRVQRLGTLPTGQTAMARPVMPDVEEDSMWARNMRQKTQQTTDSRPSRMKGSPLSGLEEEEGSLWERAMKSKVQASLASVGTQNIPQALDAVQGETPWQRMSRLNAQKTDSTPSSHTTTYDRQIINSVEDESPWERMQRMKNQGNNSISAMHSPVPAPEDETPWQRIQRLKTHGANLSSAPLLGGIVGQASQVDASPHTTGDETPWQRMARLKAQGANSATPGSMPSKISVDPSLPGRTSVAKHAWGPGLDVELSNPKGMADLLWSQSGTGSGSGRQSGWGPSLQTQIGNVLKDSKPKKGYTTGPKKVTIEDVPDEDGPDVWKGPEARLPSDSRMILDIAEPQPSVPPTMFENIFQYGEGADEQDEEEYDTGLSSAIPTPSTAPTSPPNDEPLDEEWYMSAMEEMGRGNWDKVLKKSGQVSAEPKQQQARWQAPVSQKRASSLLSQSVDSAKLLSALEAVDERPPPASPAKPPPTAAAATPPTAPAVVEKKEPATKPSTVPPAVKEAKGKGKKGKGRK